MQIRMEELEGREHFVVPVVLAVEGVLHGSNGPLLYPANELRKSVRHWNGRPIVIYHPDMYNEGLAGNPTVFNRQKVGTLFHARFEDNALKAEAWLDAKRLAQVDRRVLASVRNRVMVEVSTGLFVDHEETPGSFQGIEYQAIARNYRPDHLAILPDQIGACSIADGAGLCRNHVKGVEALLPCVMTF